MVLINYMQSIVFLFYFYTYCNKKKVKISKGILEEIFKKFGFENGERITKAYLGLEDDYLKLN